MKKQKNPWVSIVACLVVQLCVGILYLWSAFKGNIVKAYGWDAASANMVSSYMIFAFVFGNAAPLANLGARAFFDVEIAPSISQFVDRRFEDMVIQYFRRRARAGALPGVLDFGSYWYDDPRARSNGEFDCVLVRKDSLDFFECKRFDRPMTHGECEAEERQVRAVPGANIGTVGFVCTGGFDFETDGYRLVSGEDLFAEDDALPAR